MTLVSLLIGVLVIGLLCWLVQMYMPPPFKTPTLVVLIAIAVIWVLVSFFPSVAGTRVP